MPITGFTLVSVYVNTPPSGAVSPSVEWPESSIVMVLTSRSKAVVPPRSAEPNLNVNESPLWTKLIVGVCGTTFPAALSSSQSVPSAAKPTISP